MPKSAIDKLNASKEPKVVQKLPEGARSWAPPGGSMVVSTPKEVDALIKQIPKGRLATLTSIRECLAERYGTSIACPVSTAIFINIAAQAAAEMRDRGVAKITPFWRVLRADGSLNEKYPGGMRLQKALLMAEGHGIEKRGKNYAVEGFEKKLTDLKP